MTKPTHLETTFLEAEKLHPDLMEPYSSRLAEAKTSTERVACIESGLRETFRRRHPMAEEKWPKAKVEAVAP